MHSLTSPAIFALIAFAGAWHAEAAEQTPAQAQAVAMQVDAHWEPCGWGGGGFYWSAVFHPTKDGVIYLGQDAGGLSKTTDHGMSWKMINNGLVHCGVFSLAVDRSHPDTIYAGTVGGTCKSVDAGEHWRFLPKTGPNDLNITAERNISVRSIAVDPSNGDIVYAASPSGKVFKSTDGGETWVIAYEKKADAEDTNAAFVQFGGINGAWFAGAWLNLAYPADANAADCQGIGFSFRGDKVKMEESKPTKFFVTIKNAAGLTYQSRDLVAIFQDDQWRDVILKAEDFTIDPGSAKKFPEAANAAINWSQMNRLDFSCNGPMSPPAVARFKAFGFAFAGDGGKSTLRPIRDFTSDTFFGVYGNARSTMVPPARSISSVAVALKDPALVVAATLDHGLVLSEDAGKTWRELDTPKGATSAVIADADPNIMFACFGKDGVWKSTDKGKTWVASSEGIPDKANMHDIAVSPANAIDVYCTGDGAACLSNDGGKTWRKSEPMFVDLDGDPTRHYGGANPKTPIIRSKNIVINPQNPKELYIACDWRPCWSGDGGLTWFERARGSDISCNTDIRFSKGRVYASAMDEGALVSDDNGISWRQLWPLKFDYAESGHCWRIAVNTIDGIDHILTGFNPWTPKQNIIILSDDGGKSHQIIKTGLPDYLPRKNTMWETGNLRAMTTDPADPKIIYIGIDGDSEPGKSGGGIFKSEDGGHTWKQLPNQPGSRRMFYGLAVDPTNSKRIVWGACNSGGGVWLTDDGGETWKNVFNQETWIWNIVISKDGRIYASGSNLWRSADHGRTWTQLTTFKGRKIQGMEVDPRDPKTFWICAYGKDRLTEQGIYKTTDDGATWTDITGDCPNRAPQVLRFNPETNELWSGWVGLYKIKQ